MWIASFSSTGDILVSQFHAMLPFYLLWTSQNIFSEGIERPVAQKMDNWNASQVLLSGHKALIGRLLYGGHISHLES